MKNYFSKSIMQRKVEVMNKDNFELPSRQKKEKESPASVLTVEINWIPVETPPKEVGWFVGAVSPINHKDLQDKGNSWRKEFGFTKVWYNPDSVDQWYEPDPHGYRNKPVGDRITHWAYPPKVPIL